MCAQFIHSAFGDKGGGVQLVCEGTYGLAWGVIFDGRKDRGVVCVSLFFNAGGSVCGHVCVNTHTHTHAAQTGYLDVSHQQKLLLFTVFFFKKTLHSVFCHIAQCFL